MAAQDVSALREAREVAEWGVPTRRGNAIFQAKVLCHRARRGVGNLFVGPARLGKDAAPESPAVLGESRTPLWAAGVPEERRYELGKVHNLRRAAARIDGIVIPAGQVFGFWRQIGRVSRRRGFVNGRMLKEGCLVPAVGGGLCQLSNALYDAALQSGCEIVERHAHSRIVAGSAAAAGRDATVAWNYVDLRFRAFAPLRIEVRLSADELIVRFHGQPGPGRTASGAPTNAPGDALPVARSCTTCGEVSCFRHESAPREEVTGCTAFLVDENWPEFRDYVAATRRGGDILGVPLDLGRHTPARYRWGGDGFGRTGSAPLAAILRAVTIRRAPAQGAARRQAELAGTERIAARLARLLTPEVTSVCVAQSLLPHLWRDGHFGGRRIEVLMTRLPMAELQNRLDHAFAEHPGRATLGDFRASSTLVAAETEALALAARIITPHRDIAALFPGKALLLDWRMPAPPAAAPAAPRPRRIAFPGPTVARKGAFELRDVAASLGLEVALLGSELEGDAFWGDVSTCRPDSARRFDGIAAVVQPALVEDQPRHLLAALDARVPVIATPACGIGPHPLLTLVPAGDPRALTAALAAVSGCAVPSEDR
ncbi:MAG TPA: VanW family protein [Stellaceae bacterium]|jgi:hypothetical protein